MRREESAGCRQGPETAADTRPSRQGFRLEVRERVATLTIDRPPLNVLDIRTLRDMTAALRRRLDRGEANVLVVAGAGKAFSAGVDVAEHCPSTVHEMIHAFHDFCRALLDCPVPTIARVHGAALGGGCEIALCCDRTVAAASARLGLPEITLGVFPPIAAVLLPRRCGSAIAARAVLWGQILGADAAQRAGLVDEVASDEGIDACVESMVQGVARLSAPALRLARRALRRGAVGSVEDALADVERIYLEDLMKTEDAREGLAAFMEKRPPVWRHR